MSSLVPEGGSKQADEKKKQPVTFRRALVNFMVKLAVLAVVILLLVTVVGGVFICHTSDMYPALRDGDLVITFRLGTYHSGDIVAYEYQGKTYFGRIVGEAGDQVFLDDAGTYTINGIAPYEMVFYETTARESDTMSYPYVIAEGEYFILADAREQGLDSRNFGPITKLKGKAVLQLRRRGF